MAILRPLSVITININGLSFPIKRHGLAEQIFLKDFSIDSFMLSGRNSLQIKNSQGCNIYFM